MSGNQTAYTAGRFFTLSLDLPHAVDWEYPVGELAGRGFFVGRTGSDLPHTQVANCGDFPPFDGYLTAIVATLSDQSFFLC